MGKILHSFSCVSFTLIRLPHSHLWHQTCWGFSYIFHRQFWDQLASYNLTQFDTVNLIKDSVPWDSPGFRCQSQVASAQIIHNFCPTWLQVRQSHDLLLGFYYLQEQLTELRETFTCFTSLLKDVIKNTDEQRSIGWSLGGSWAQQLLTPWSWGMCHLPDIWMSSPTWKIFETNTLNSLWGFSNVDMVNYQLHFQPSPISGEWVGGGTENFEFLIMAWSFWWPVPIQKPSRSLPTVASLRQKVLPVLLVLLSLRDLQGF